MKVIIFVCALIMVHLCNMKISADLIGQKSKGRFYDIDGFISQLLASRKFDDLAEKLAEKAANRIMHIDKAESPLERATDDKDVDNSTESTQVVNQHQSKGESVKKYKNIKLNNVKLRKDFAGKINPQAVINVTTSLSENLQLNYKYLKRNALEKKEKSNRNTLHKNDTKEDNKTTGHAAFKDQHNKTEGRTLNQNATEKCQNDTIKESIDENKHSRDDKKDNDRKEDSNRNSELNERSHSGMDGKTNNSSKKPYYSLEDEGQRLEQAIFRETQQSGPDDKGFVEREVSRVGSEREDKLSSLEEENQKHLTRSEEKLEEVQQNEGEPEQRGTGEINEDETVIPQFRAHEDSIEDNKVTSDYNPSGRVHGSKASDDRSSEKQSPEDQSSKAQSAEDPNSSEFKPLIRKEGNMLYTYNRAPEYEEYHEKLAKWQQKHPENPVDFMK